MAEEYVFRIATDRRWRPRIRLQRFVSLQVTWTRKMEAARSWRTGQKTNFRCNSSVKWQYRTTGGSPLLCSTSDSHPKDRTRTWLKRQPKDISVTITDVNFRTSFIYLPSRHGIESCDSVTESSRKVWQPSAVAPVVNALSKIVSERESVGAFSGRKFSLHSSSRSSYPPYCLHLCCRRCVRFPTVRDNANVFLVFRKIWGSFFRCLRRPAPHTLLSEFFPLLSAKIACGDLDCVLNVIRSSFRRWSATYVMDGKQTIPVSARHASHSLS